MKKGSILYKGMARYRIKFLVINILLTILFCVYAYCKLPYLKAAWFPEEEIDMERFVSETATIVVDTPIELTRKDRENPDAAYLKRSSYWQDDQYRFVINADSIKKTDKVFKGKIPTNNGEIIYEDMYDLYIADIGGRKAAVLAMAGQKVDKTMTACIVHMQKPILAKLSEIAQKEGAAEYYDCIIDVRGLEMEAEISDHVFFWFYLAIILYLYIKLGIYFVKPQNTPTYRQLFRYGKPETIAEEIDRQSKLSSARRNGGTVVLEGFILSKSFMKLKVIKNHTAKN